MRLQLDFRAKSQESRQTNKTEFVMTEEEKAVMPSEEGAVETKPEEQVAEEQPKGRAAAILAFRAKYPERFGEEGAADPEDDEMWDDHMTEHSGMMDKLNQLTEANGKYADREMKFVALIDNNPDLQELLAAINEDDEFIESIKQRKARFAEKEANAQETVKNIIAWQKEDGLTDEERIARVNWIIKLAENIDNDIITRDIWESAGKAINHDTDVEDAAKAAELAVRNADIEKKKLALKNGADIMPDVNKGSAAKQEVTPPTENKKPYRFLDDMEEVS